MLPVSTTDPQKNLTNIIKSNLIVPIFKHSTYFTFFKQPLEPF